MKKVSTLQAALLGSSSALGINWIYDRPFLKTYLEDKNPIFLPIDHEAYRQVENGFDVYPNHKVGDLDFMGECLYLLHMHLEYGKDKRTLGFRESVFEYLKPNGNYDGYIEKYGKELIQAVINERQKDLEPQVHTEYEDTQLIGPAIFLGVYDNPKSVNKVADSLNYAKVFTSYSGVNYFNNLLNNLFTDLEHGKEKNQALKDNIKFAPKKYQKLLEKAVSDINLEDLLASYAGVACDLKQSFPMVYYIVANSNNWEEALQFNASLGGASSARGMFVSAIFSLIDDIPDEYLNKLNYRV